MNIQQILDDWNSSFTHGEIKARHGITNEQEFAITLCSDGLSISEIENRLIHLRLGMKGDEIEATMNVTQLDKMLAEEQEVMHKD